MAIINSTEYPVGTVISITILSSKYLMLIILVERVIIVKIQIVKEIFVMQYRMNVIIKELTVVVFYVQIEKIIYVL